MENDPINPGKYVMAVPRIELQRSKILIVDDEESSVRLLERVLKRAQFGNVVSTTEPRGVQSLFQLFQPDLVLTDLLMPHLSGLVVVKQLRSLMCSGDYLPIVVLTADVTQETRRQALAVGATDFLTKPFDIVEVVLRIGNLLQARLAHLKLREQMAALEEEVRLRTLNLQEALLELKTLQNKLIQQEQLATLGTMARRVALDFSNTLALVISYGEELLRDAEHGLTKDKASFPIMEILNAARDAVKIVFRLREFSRPGQTRELRLPVDVHDLIQQVVSLTKPKWQIESLAAHMKIGLSVDFGEIPRIDGDPTELREVFAGLISNAVEAMPHGGSIMFSTRAEGDTVLVQISDTGTGMTEEVRQRCLEPSFSTKPRPGAGVGLDTIFGIVRRHRGAFDIESEPGKGTTFTLRFPMAS